MSGGFGFDAFGENRLASMNRPEVQMLQEIVPKVDKSVLLEILKGNNFDLSASIDAALALAVSLDAEEGRPVIDTNRSARQGGRSNSSESLQSRGYVTSVTAHDPPAASPPPKAPERRLSTDNSTTSGVKSAATTPTAAPPPASSSSTPATPSSVAAAHKRSVLNARAKEIDQLIGPNGKLNPSQGVVSSSGVTTNAEGGAGKEAAKTAYVDRKFMQSHSTMTKRNKRGADVVLPASFLSAPRFHVTVHKAGESVIQYSVLFRRINKARLGISIQDINGDIYIQHLYRTDDNSESSDPLLALEAGVHIGDILTGINDEYFSPGPEIQDIVDMLHLEDNLLTLHFKRYRINATSGIASRDVFQPHKFAVLLQEQHVITSEMLRFVSRSISYQSRRILSWDTEAIAKRIIRWHLQNMASSFVDEYYIYLCKPDVVIFVGGVSSCKHIREHDQCHASRSISQHIDSVGPAIGHRARPVLCWWSRCQ
jgi:hypothetical protein